jgi:hypothetical protein
MHYLPLPFLAQSNKKMTSPSECLINRLMKAAEDANVSWTKSDARMSPSDQRDLEENERVVRYLLNSVRDKLKTLSCDSGRDFCFQVLRALVDMSFQWSQYVCSFLNAEEQERFDLYNYYATEGAIDYIYDVSERRINDYSLYRSWDDLWNFTELFGNLTSCWGVYPHLQTLFAQQALYRKFPDAVQMVDEALEQWEEFYSSSSTKVSDDSMSRPYKRIRGVPCTDKDDRGFENRLLNRPLKRIRESEHLDM